MKRDFFRPVTTGWPDGGPTDSEFASDGKENLGGTARHLDRVAFRPRTGQSDLKFGRALEQALTSGKEDRQEE
ncbi:MAG: hypothetical protein DRP71_04245 [Verrucomicrobia bacterium]|nr:MAG: hypothetical protein DRP71_04245 [Verrucomicrobiota bacterium]